MDRAMSQEDQQNYSRMASMLAKESVGFVRDRIRPDELPALRLEIRQTAKQIYENWETLGSIVQRHEATIQRRWTKKSKSKRRELLLTAWPNMAQQHRPDIVLENNACFPTEIGKVGRNLLKQRPWERKMCEGSQREALLMPYINLHDLTKTEPLLLMINARARQPPSAFAKRDLQLSTQCIILTEWRQLHGYVMDLDGRQSAPEAYGELREQEWEDLFVTTGADPRLADGVINPGDGLWVLEIQDRVYKFLLDIVQKLLHDIPTGDLIGPKYSIQPEPPLPSANCREDGVVSLDSTKLEAIYAAPGRMDLHRLQLLVTAKANEQEDKLWDLREDPGNFSQGLKDYIAHQPEYVPDLSGSQHSTATIDGCRTRPGSDTRTPEDVSSIFFLLSQFECVSFWSWLVRDITGLVELKKTHFDNRNIEPGDPLPEPFKMALYKSQYVLCLCIERRLSILITDVYSSPPFRPYFRRASPDTLDTFVPNPDKKPPRHVLGFLNLLHRLCYGDELKIRGHIAGVQSLLENYEKFIKTVPDAHLAVSSYVAQGISYLSLLSECLRQIHLFEPWAATSLRELETPRAKEALSAHLKDLQCSVRPVASLKTRIRDHSMISALVKSPYPVHKKRTVANVDAMQKAEALLDLIWDDLLAEMEHQKALTAHVTSVLFLQGRQLQRTPDWVEPVKPTKKTPFQVASPKVLVQPFGGFNIDDNNKVQDLLTEKPKIKTRGTATPQDSSSGQLQEASQEDQSPAHTIQVDRRALKVFSTLFHTPFSTSKPGEVPWTEFLYAMRSAGFGMESLQGSAWQFTPHDDTGSGMGAGKRSILFHEPHPHSRIPFWDARRLGRRLARTYGWSGETFVVK